GVGAGAGGAMPDIANSGVPIRWGSNPSFTRLTHAIAVVAALKRGMRLIVVDPRHVGLAGKADVWLRVRPGTDGALALGLANLMIERGWYDRDFIRDWSNGPHLVRADTGRLLTERDLAPGLLLHLERPRAPRQRHADGSRDVAALRPHWLVRPARRERTVHPAAGRADRRPRVARGAKHGPRGGPRRASTRAGALGLRR